MRVNKNRRMLRATHHTYLDVISFKQNQKNKFALK